MGIVQDMYRQMSPKRRIKMGIFICCECDHYRDSDDGCEECHEHKSTFGLICQDCLENRPDEEDEN